MACNIELFLPMMRKREGEEVKCKNVRLEPSLSFFKECRHADLNLQNWFRGGSVKMFQEKFRYSLFKHVI